MSSFQNFVSPQGWYSLEYPRTWESEIIDGIPAFYDPLFSDGGVIQIFAAKLGDLKERNEITKASPFVTGETLEEKMHLFLEEQISVSADQIMPKQVVDGNEFIAHEYRIENRFYMAAMYQKENSFLLALYNSPGDPSPEEAVNIAQIIRTIRLT